jgi:hypothetical protein
MVRQPLSGKAVANESKYPYIVELVVADDILDLEVSRRMMDFHRSRKIQARHGRRVVREGRIYFRWCFSDFGRGPRVHGTVRRRSSATRTAKTLTPDKARLRWRS